MYKVFNTNTNEYEEGLFYIEDKSQRAAIMRLDKAKEEYALKSGINVERLDFLIIKNHRGN